MFFEKGTCCIPSPFAKKDWNWKNRQRRTGRKLEVLQKRVWDSLKSGVWIPVEFLEEPLSWAAPLLPSPFPGVIFSQWMAIPDVTGFQTGSERLLLFSSFPWGDFLQSRTSNQNGLWIGDSLPFLFPAFPRTRWVFQVKVTAFVHAAARAPRLQWKRFDYIGFANGE